MKYQLRLLLLLGILFPANGKSAGRPIECGDKAPAYFSGIFSNVDNAVPGWVTDQAVFENIRATLHDHSLIVHWISRAGEKSSCFEVQVSEDSVCFANIGIVRSGTPDDNAPGATLYELKVPTRKYAVSIGGALLVAAAFFRISRRRMGLALCIMLTLLSAIIICYRSSQMIGSSGSIRFVRIAITDKKGVRSYSEVVKVHKALAGKMN